MDWEQLHDHIVICGWNNKAEIVLEEMRASSAINDQPIVVIARMEHREAEAEFFQKRKIWLLDDDFTRVAALERAGIHRAKTCILLADLSEGRSEQDADARTILAALTVEKLNHSVYTCAELLNRSYGSHLTMGNVNDFVVSGEFGAHLLAQSAISGGVMGVFSELMTCQRGNEFYRVEVPDSWIGKSFDQQLSVLREEHQAILVGVESQGEEMRVNPKSYTFASGDHIAVIAEKQLSLN